MSISDAHQAFLNDERGIRPETAEAFGLYTDGDTLVLPHKTGEKRRWFKGDERGFSFTKDRKPFLYGIDYEGADTVFLVEGETDTMRLWQALKDDGSEAAQRCSVAGIPGINTWKSVWARALEGATRIFVILDNDPAYLIRAEVEKLRERLQEDLGDRAVQVRLPSDVKDLCEFFRDYDLDALRERVGESINGTFHYEALDLSIDPPPYEWMIKGFIAKNDTVLWAGVPKVGKSMLAFDLAIAVARGLDKWLEMQLLVHGRVLYVDEENPLDVVYNRLHGLGSTPEARENIRYLHRQGIRLDKHPGKLLDEVKAWKPELIVLDSLKRFHRLDENSASDMSTVFEDGIMPITEASGATVLVLHHATKSNAGSSFQSIRGSGDITAAVDSAIEIGKASSEGGVYLKHFMGRRSTYHDTVYATIKGDETSIEITEGAAF